MPRLNSESSASAAARAGTAHASESAAARAEIGRVDELLRFGFDLIPRLFNAFFELLGFAAHVDYPVNFVDAIDAHGHQRGRYQLGRAFTRYLFEAFMDFFDRRLIRPAFASPGSGELIVEGPREH